MAPKDHVIRIEREGTAPRWVRHISRGEPAECTVTWHAEQARRMTAKVAQEHAARLDAMARSRRVELLVQRVREEQSDARL